MQIYFDDVLIAGEADMNALETMLRRLDAKGGQWLEVQRSPVDRFALRTERASRLPSLPAAGRRLTFDGGTV